MKEEKNSNCFVESSSTTDDFFEIRSMLPQQVMRILWDGFSKAIDHALLTKKSSDITFAAQMYSSLIDGASDLPELQAEYWLGRADDYLPGFWCIWMHWLEQGYTEERVLH